MFKEKTNPAGKQNYRVLPRRNLEPIRAAVPERIYGRFASVDPSGRVTCIYITCTVHRTVISVEHFAIASVIPYSRLKRSDLYTLSWSKLLENHTLHSDIYTYVATAGNTSAARRLDHELS